MNTILVTLGIAFVIILACVSLMGISMLLTGKSRFRVGMCGRTPTQKKDAEKGCGSAFSCGICGKEGDKSEEEE